jgi:hypothetical protein
MGRRLPDLHETRRHCLDIVGGEVDLVVGIGGRCCNIVRCATEETTHTMKEATTTAMLRGLRNLNGAALGEAGATAL